MNIYINQLTQPTNLYSLSLNEDVRNSLIRTYINYFGFVILLSYLCIIDNVLELDFFVTPLVLRIYMGGEDHLP